MHPVGVWRELHSGSVRTAARARGCQAVDWRLARCLDRELALLSLAGHRGNLWHIHSGAIHHGPVLISVIIPVMMVISVPVTIPMTIPMTIPATIPVTIPVTAI